MNRYLKCQKSTASQSIFNTKKIDICKLTGKVMHATVLTNSSKSFLFGALYGYDWPICLTVGKFAKKGGKNQLKIIFCQLNFQTKYATKICLEDSYLLLDQYATGLK